MRNQIAFGIKRLYLWGLQGTKIEDYELWPNEPDETRMYQLDYDKKSIYCEATWYNRGSGAWHTMETIRLRTVK